MEGGVFSRKNLAIWAVALLVLDFPCPASAATCTEVQTNLQPCIGAMNGLLPGSPSTACCNGLKVVLGLERALGVGAACNCTKNLILTVPGLNIDVRVSSDLQNQCNVDLGFSLANNDQCTG